jgi:hypothetical protein
MSPSGIEPATFRFVAQCLNQMRHRVPPELCRMACLNVINTYRSDSVMKEFAVFII